MRFVLTERAFFPAATVLLLDALRLVAGFVTGFLALFDFFCPALFCATTGLLTVFGVAAPALPAMPATSAKLAQSATINVVKRFKPAASRTIADPCYCWIRLLFMHFVTSVKQALDVYETLEAVITARNAAASGLAAAKANPGDPAAMQQLANSEGALGSVLGRLFALSEAYPDLKANTTMMQLSEELTTTENKVAFARQAYNDDVMNYNNRREVFPTSVIANGFAFQPAQLLDIESPEKREAVKVSFT